MRHEHAYMFGLLEHEAQQADTKFENDPSADQDIIIENGDGEDFFVDGEEDKTGHYGLRTEIWINTLTLVRKKSYDLTEL